MSELMDSTDICEALVRHVEASGSEVFEKNFVVGGVVKCSVWCVVGDNAQDFALMVREWLVDSGFSED